MSATHAIRVHRNRIVGAALALVVLGTGVAAAAVGLNEVGSAQVRNEALTGSDIKNSSIYSSDVRDGGLLGRDVKAETITGREVAERSLGVPSNISQLLPAVEAASAAAGAALPETLLLSRGDLSITASCWRQVDTRVMHLDLFVRTSTNGGMLQSTLDSKPGGTAAASFLNIDTVKEDRQIASPDAAANSFRLHHGGMAEFPAWSPGGDYLRGELGTVVQHGVVAGVTPPLGAGNTCQVVGYVSAVAT